MLRSLCLAVAGASASGQFPVIAIMSQPTKSTAPTCGGSCEYIAASYIKFFESAGARAVPVSYYSSDAEIDAIMKEVNAFFFPGGGSALPAAAQRVVDAALNVSESGGFFPVYGICLGFEWIVKAVGGDHILGSGFDSENISLPLRFTDAATSSRFFSDASTRALLAKEPLTMNNHQQGLSPTAFKNSSELSSVFHVLSTNADRKGQEFVSSIEGRSAPIYGTQYHPEKNIFEWGTNEDGSPYEVIQHTADAVHVSQSIANFFVSEARKNENVYDLKKEGSFFEHYPKENDKLPTFVEVYYLFPRKEPISV
jgi:gamma-glutamyl hydrolase